MARKKDRVVVQRSESKFIGELYMTDTSAAEVEEHVEEVCFQGDANVIQVKQEVNERIMFKDHPELAFPAYIYSCAKAELLRMVRAIRVHNAKKGRKKA